MTKPHPETGTDIALPAPTDLACLFKAENGIDPIISQIEAAVNSEAAALDPATKKGRDALKSLAHKVSQSKAELDRQGLALTEAARRDVEAVNAGRRVVKDRLDALRDRTKAPALDWESKDAERIDRHKSALLTFDLDRANAADTTEVIQQVIAEIEALPEGEAWDEFSQIASEKRTAALVKYRADLSAAKTRVAEQAELARLRAEAENRARMEAEQAAAKAQADRIEREKAEAERLAAEKAERERIAAEEAARAESARREQAERDKAKAAEIARAEAESRARRDAEEAARRHEEAIAAEQRRAEEAVERERQRHADDRRREEEARAKREANKKHREKVLAEIAADLAGIEHADIPAALMEGRVSRVQVML